MVQVFTKRNASGFEAGGTFAAGSLSAREGTVRASFGDGPFAFTAGFRRTTTDGDLPNEFFAATNAAASAELTSGAVRVGVTFRRDESRSGVPFSGATVTPRQFTTSETTAVSVPVAVSLGASTTLEAAATYTKDRPTYSNVDDPYGFTFARTEAGRAGGRITLVTTLGVNRVSVGADYERTRVDDEDSFGVEIDGKTTRTVSAFAEDRISLFGEKLVATAGIRYDDHSAFGGHTSPRVTLAYRPIPSLKLRAAAGGAFRSPSTGELYYPFSGNPALRPERSVSYELGGDYDVAPSTTLSLSLFQNDVRDLIDYDFTTSTDQNVGRARTRGMEAGVTMASSGGRFLRASYTYLDAVDRDTGLPLLRRPRHRASATFGARVFREATAELTALFVGRRDDVDAVTFARVTDASYFRLDLALSGPKLLGHLTPFLKLTNLLGRDYVEVAGFPSPGRRVLGGLELGF